MPGRTLEPAERFRSDAAIALALIHHLLLKPPFYDVGAILESIGRYSYRYVFIEFMPLGLHDGQSSPPVPEWYTIEWFRTAFARHFEFVGEEQLEPNRVLFIGKLLP
jgi:hypothetical protein